MVEETAISDVVTRLGINLDCHYFVKEKLAIGFSKGWQVFNDNRGYIT